VLLANRMRRTMRSPDLIRLVDSILDWKRQCPTAVPCLICWTFPTEAQAKASAICLKSEFPSNSHETCRSMVFDKRGGGGIIENRLESFIQIKKRKRKVGWKNSFYKLQRNTNTISDSKVTGPLFLAAFECLNLFSNSGIFVSISPFGTAWEELGSSLRNRYDM
jgi:hypothetical protein